MKRGFFIFFAVLHVYTACARENNVSLKDSIEKVLEHSKTDTVTCFRLLQWASNLSTAEHKAAVRVCKWAITAAKKNGNKKCLAQAWYSLGRCYQVIDDFKTATVYFKKAAELADKYGFYGLQGKLFSCFANTYSAVKQYTLAQQYYYKAIKVIKAHKLKDDLPGIYFNLASLQYEAKPDSNYIENALANIRQALATAQPDDNYDVIAYSLWLKGLIYAEHYSLDSTIVFMDQAFAIAKQYDFADFYSPYYFYRGQFLKSQEKYTEALQVFAIGLEDAQKKKSNLWQYNFYGEMANVTAHLGDFKKAFEYHKQYKVFYDSVVNTENFGRLNDLETQLKLEKKEKEKEISNLLLQRSEQRQQNLWWFIGSTVLVVLILSIFVIMLVRNVRARKQAYLKLQQKNIAIQQQGEQLAQLSGEISRYQAQMNPHFVFNALNSIQGFVVNNEKEKTLEQLGNFSRLMRTTLNNSNQISIPVSNEIEYLKTFMAFEQARFRNEIQFKVDLRADDKETMVPPMMIQPLLENALKHARLGDVEDAMIQLEIHADQNLLRIAITDNGKGIQGNVNEVFKRSHSMSILKSRIQLVFDREKMPLPHSYFALASIPVIARGTRVEFCLPLISEF
ncbi:MAG TPA: histidine kinase [Flavobacteriales bacterium]|nr:histidine kinase [Flavobacteriales bacterium]